MSHSQTVYSYTDFNEPWMRATSGNRCAHYDGFAWCLYRGSFFWPLARTVHEWKAARWVAEGLLP